MPRALTVALAVVLLLLLGGLAERLIVTEEERVELAYAAIVSAIREERAADLATLIAPTLPYAGPAPVGSGDRQEALARFDELFEAARDIAIIRHRPTEITVQPGFATFRAPQFVRFRYGDMFVAYKMDAVLTFDRAGEHWLLSQVEITSLTPGIL